MGAFHEQYFKAQAVVARGNADSDGDSQEEIIRRDEVEISYADTAPQSRVEQ